MRNVVIAMVVALILVAIVAFVLWTVFLNAVAAH
jgi:hypothetical protein